MVGIIRSSVLMVLGTMVFRDVVAKVFYAGVPKDFDVFVGCLIHDPEIPHFHGPGALAFDGVIGYADSRGVVAVDGGSRLRMAHLVED